MDVIVLVVGIVGGIGAFAVVVAFLFVKTAGSMGRKDGGPAPQGGPHVGGNAAVAASEMYNANNYPSYLNNSNGSSGAKGGTKEMWSTNPHFQSPSGGAHDQLHSEFKSRVNGMGV
jgi:hypothetical protein